MNTRLKIAFWCYFLAALLLVGFGVVYLFRREFMPFHAIAADMPWSDVPPGFQAITLALMKALGGAHIVLALAVYVILFGPFRQGVRWARLTIPLLGLLSIAVTFYAMTYVAAHTPATPPFWAPTLGAALTLTAFVLSIYPFKATPIPDGGQ